LTVYITSLVPNYTKYSHIYFI